jgi:glutathione synthase/RimK-type ligase-like ATP-grasp enzyme
MSKPRIGIVSCIDYFERAVDDEPLVAEFQKRGHRAERVCWDDVAVTWERFETLILRSPWDYSWRMHEFMAWLERVEQTGARIWNGPDVIRWNSNKRYLRILEAQGVLLPPTEWIEPHAKFELEEILARRGWTDAVVKPIVDAGGVQASRIKRGEMAAHAIYENHEVRGRGLMVQEFMPEILSPGEYGFAFFNRKLSHVALKTPTGGEFRSQTAHGGIWQPVELPRAMVQQAEAVLALIKEPLLYGRVDGIFREGTFILMELELFEPWLFFEYTTGGEARFVTAFEELNTTT